MTDEGDHGPYCEDCGDCKVCFGSEWCAVSPSGKHRFVEDENDA